MISVAVLLAWVGVAALVGVLAVRRQRLFFVAFLLSLLLVPALLGLLYCFLPAKYAAIKDRASAMLIDLFIANVLAAVIFFLPAQGWILSDFQMVFGTTLGWIICWALGWAPVLVLVLVVAGSGLSLLAIDRLRKASGRPAAIRARRVLTVTWLALMTARLILYLTRSW